MPADREAPRKEAGEALKRCVTCERVPLTLFTYSDGMIARVRFGCLCSSVILYADSEQNQQPTENVARRVEGL
jgi:hypothetical protein